MIPTRVPRRRRWTLALVALLVLLGLMLGWKAVRVADAAARCGRDVDGALALARQLQAEPGNGEALAALGPGLESTSRSLGALRAEVEPLRPLLALARWLPGDLSWPADLEDALAVAVPLGRVGAEVARPLSAAAISSRAGGGGIGGYLPALAELGAMAPEMRRQLDQVEPALARLRGRPLGGPLRRLGPAVDRLMESLPEVRLGLELLPAVAPALGMEGPRGYLLLGQNSGEIRATGGFIGSAGVVTLDRGAVARLEYGSSYGADAGVEPPPPPAPMARYLGLGGWYLRDANWWPDFPATAAQVEQAWRRAGHGPVDGVIAFDTTAVRGLLEALGPVEVPGLGSVSAEDFERIAATQLYSAGALSSAGSFHQAKGAFLAPLGAALVGRVQTLSAGELLPLGKELLRLLETKHLQLAFKDRRLSGLARTVNWDGAIPAVAGDSLLVVDTTVSYGDSYGFVTSDIRLSVEVGNVADGESHQLVLDYYNRYPHGLPSWMPPAMVGGASFDPSTGKLVETPGFWGNWLRVYLPADARFVEVQGLADVVRPWQEFDRLVVAGYLPLEPGQRRSVRVRYTRGGEQRAESHGYGLYLQKQAGLECRPISVEVRWPDGTSAGYRDCPTGDEWIVLKGSGRGYPSSREGA